MVIVSSTVAVEQPGSEVVAVDGQLFLAVSGRICPCCGLRGLIGNGYRLRTYRTEPVRRGRKVPKTLVYRVVCTKCRHNRSAATPQPNEKGTRPEPRKALGL